MADASGFRAIVRSNELGTADKDSADGKFIRGEAPLVGTSPQVAPIGQQQEALASANEQQQQNVEISRS